MKRYDALVHCAGVIDEEFVKSPREAFHRSIFGTEALLKKSVEAGIRVAVYFSSAHVYGKLEGEITEDTPVNPINDYAIAHTATEQIFKWYALKEGIKTLILRPNAVYGLPVYPDSFQRWQLIPFAFPKEAVQLQRITLKSSGSQKRNFICADDLAGYVCSFLRQAGKFDLFSVVNPVGPETLSVYNFALKCCNLYHKLTGNRCAVMRPEVEDEVIAHFEYGSKNRYYQATYRIEPAIESVMNFLLSRMKSKTLPESISKAIRAEVA